MRKMYEHGLIFDTDSQPIRMWISQELFTTVKNIFTQNYGLPFASEAVSTETAFQEYEVTMAEDLTPDVFLRHLKTGAPGAYRNEMQRTAQVAGA
ncbi:hypothetical protein RP29_06050 [Acidovorax temperans]|uniref:Uncharacterized protein n=1 Tax=Acidovorax temperans TaxID=80878 RepID=A0A0D7KA91_9BURK|nr:hypothetical protein [Acidovorax temperans]KJA11286.1 hypothetical protein RP29_06050 [Acidovorax temperans]